MLIKSFFGKQIFNDFIHDLHHGSRCIYVNPGFTVIVVLILALGIGANITIFSVINSVILNPLPFKSPQQLVRCNWQYKSITPEENTVTNTVYSYWKEHSKSFEDAAAFTYFSSGYNLISKEDVVHVRGMRVTHNFLRMLGATPVLGRDISKNEDLPGGPLVALISDETRANYFSKQPEIIGSRILLNDKQYTIIGVFPRQFKFEHPVDVIIPMQMRVDPRDQDPNTGMLARIKSDVTLTQAQLEMSQVLKSFHNSAPGHVESEDKGIKLIPYKQHIVGDISKILYLLFGIVGCVLLIACTNVTNLFLARSISRKGELAVRVALGASRGRLIRQLLTENLILSLLSGIVGIVVSLITLPVILSVIPSDFPRANEIKINIPAILLAFFVSVLISVLFGILPALRATQADINDTLKYSTAKFVSSRRDMLMRNLLIIGEIALTIILVICAGLTIKSLINLHKVELGFDTNDVTTMQISLNSTRYREGKTIWDFNRQVIEKLKAASNVTAAASVSSLPMERGLQMGISIPGHPDKARRTTQIRFISPEYFQVLKIPILNGRTFKYSDLKETSPVIIINKALHDTYWKASGLPNETISLAGAQRHIVGVVDNIKETGLDQVTKPTIYLPASQVPDGLARTTAFWFLTSWIVRTNGPVDFNSTMKGIVKEVDPQMPIANIRQLPDVIKMSIVKQRLVTILMVTFAVLAIILSTVGLYSVLNYIMSQRMKEIGLRIAMGAQHSDIAKLVIMQGTKLSLFGIGIGLFLAIIISKLTTSLLFNVSSLDISIYIYGVVLLFIIMIVTCLIIVQKITSVNPMHTLHYE